MLQKTAAVNGLINPLPLRTTENGYHIISKEQSQMASNRFSLSFFLQPITLELQVDVIINYTFESFVKIS